MYSKQCNFPILLLVRTSSKGVRVVSVTYVINYTYVYEEVYNLCSSVNIIRVLKSSVRCLGHVARIANMINAHRILVGKLERKLHLMKHARKWENVIKMGECY
jgi:hypothetical protein